MVSLIKQSDINDTFSETILRDTPGTVLTTDALKSIGISPQLAHHYVKQKWLVPIGDGAYLRQNDQPSWFGALSTLQNSEIPVYVAAGQALDPTGANQNIIFENPLCTFYTSRNTPSKVVSKL